MNTQPSVEEIKKYQYIPFKVERELWTRYKLEDTTILKAKIVLVNVKMNTRLVEALKKQQENKEKVSIGMHVQVHNVFGVEVPPSLRGPPDTKTYSPNELAGSVVQEDLEFERLDPTTWISIYELEDKTKLKVQHTLIDVSKTSRYDASGDPVYLVSSSADIKVIVPQKYRPTKEITPKIEQK